MTTHKHPVFVKKPAAVFAAVIVCLSLSAGALAAAGAMQGFFQDITNWRGAIVGTSYEQATDEIALHVTANGNELTALAIFADTQSFPYSETEKLGIAAYQIVDADGTAVKAGAAESAEIVNGQATVSIPLDSIDSGSYKLVVTAFVSEKKADRPIHINGNWECTFTK